MLKKFDRPVLTYLKQPSINSPFEKAEIIEEELPSLTKKRSSIYDRMSKKMESVREYVRYSEVRQGEDDIEMLRASRQSHSRQTMKKLQRELEQMEETKLLETEDQEAY